MVNENRHAMEHGTSEHEHEHEYQKENDHKKGKEVKRKCFSITIPLEKKYNITTPWGIETRG
jgi:hypothetical protein